MHDGLFHEFWAALLPVGIVVLVLAYAAIKRLQKWKRETDERIVQIAWKRGACSRELIESKLKQNPRSDIIRRTHCLYLFREVGLASPAASDITLAFLKEFPKSLSSHWLRARALAAQGNGMAAEAMLKSGLSAVPNGDPMDLVRCLSEYAKLAEQRGDIGESTNRWRELQRRVPQRPEGFFGEGQLMFDIGEFGAAEAPLQQVVVLEPKDEPALIMRAQIAVQQQSWMGAVARWRNYRLAYSHKPLGYIEGATAAWRANDRQEAETLTASARHLFAKDPATLEQFDKLEAETAKGASPVS